MNLPTDALKTIESAAGLLLNGINDQITVLKNAIKTLEDLHRSILERLPLEPSSNDKTNTNNRLDSYSGVRDPLAAASGRPSLNFDRVFNPRTGQAEVAK